MESDELDGVIQELSSIPADPPTKREQCLRCRRPQTVCWCPFLPNEPLQIKSTIVILQHPGEEKRCLRTAPMLEFALPPTNFLLYKGRRFSSGTDDKLKSVFVSPNTVLFYPGPNAVSLESLPPVEEIGSPYNIILLDGTWPQAKSLYANCDELKKVKRVQINSRVASEYVIRTQPTEKALSTVETAAVALSTLERKPYLKEMLGGSIKAREQRPCCHRRDVFLDGLSMGNWDLFMVQWWKISHIPVHRDFYIQWRQLIPMTT